MDRSELMIRELGQIDDVLGFVVMEQMLKDSTSQRAPDFVPSQILKGGLNDWSRGRKMKKTVDERCDEMWLDLVDRALRARNDLAEWQARQRQRELEFAEELRREWKHFEAIERPKALFYHGLKMEEIREMNRGGDPSWTIERTLNSFDAVNERFRMIKESSASEAEKHQQATLLTEAIKSSLHRQP